MFVQKDKTDVNRLLTCFKVYNLDTISFQNISSNKSIAWFSKIIINNFFKFILKMFAEVWYFHLYFLQQMAGLWLYFDLPSCMYDKKFEPHAIKTAIP